MAGNIAVAGGTLHPGLAPDEAAKITDVTVAASNVLNAGGNVSIGSAGRLARDREERHRLLEAAG